MEHSSLRQEWDGWLVRDLLVGEWQMLYVGVFRASQLYAVADIWEKPG